MAIPANLTFDYQFTVQKSEVLRKPEARIWWLDRASEEPVPSIRPESSEKLPWSGQGSGGSSYPTVEALVGPKPQFELLAGWLTLLPTEGWTQSLPLPLFSDFDRSPSNLASYEKARAEAMSDATLTVRYRTARLDRAAFLEAQKARQEEMRRRGLTRNLVSFSIFVGEALENVLHIGDEFKFSRDLVGDFRYSIARNSATVFSAGSVGRIDDGGPVAVWQEYDKHPNANAEALKATFKGLLPVAEWIEVRRPYVSVRVRDQIFQLIDGQDAHVDPHYVFLARSNRSVPAIAFVWPQAVHSTGRLDLLGKELIIDAGRQLTAPKTKIL